MKMPGKTDIVENRVDHFAVTEAFVDLNTAWMSDTPAFIDCCNALNAAMQKVSRAVYEKMETSAEKTPSNGGDALMQWVRTLSWSSRCYHHVISDWLTAYVQQAPDLDAESRKRALFWVRQINEMLAPANFFWTNPKAVQRFVESDGESLIRGLHNWLNDLQRGDGLVELTDSKAFAVGQSLAVTPGRVVYCNQLMELIQYAPQTETVWQVPIVMIQPWINKYYIFDLMPQNSFVRYLVSQGFTVFITSWKNPTPDMRHTTFEDYMRNGALQAINVARQICKSNQVHATGYCIGGTLLAALMGWLAHTPAAQPVVDITLFASLLDFSDPGELGVFIHPSSLKAIEKLATADGFLGEQHLATTFRMLNPTDLIWRSVVNNYFYGEKPPRSDMLYWNSDSTRLPAAMCAFYLKSFYLENRMAQSNTLELHERPIDLKQVRQPLYAVGAAKDHICPWSATFQNCRLVGGRVRYVLADEGHITGIVNPPSPWNKKRYWAGAATRRRDATKWLQGRNPVKGSWWPDWVAWLQPRSGSRQAPPSMGSKRYPALGPAPGTYVFEK